MSAADTETAELERQIRHAEQRVNTGRKVGVWLAIIVTAFGLTVLVPNWDGAGGTTPQATCSEDEPCWDCETMGNLQCGPERPPARRVDASRLS